MDLNGVRRFLPSYNREQLGETVDIVPMTSGKMAERPDASRPATTIRVRFEFTPDLERLVEARSSDLAGQTERASITFEAGLLPYTLKDGDLIRRTNPETGAIEDYRVSRRARLALALEVAYLSRI